VTHCQGIQCLFNLFYDLISFKELFSNPRRRPQLRLYYLKQGSIGGFSRVLLMQADVWKKCSLKINSKFFENCFKNVTITFKYEGTLSIIKRVTPKDKNSYLTNIITIKNEENEKIRNILLTNIIVKSRN